MTRYIVLVDGVVLLGDISALFNPNKYYSNFMLKMILSLSSLVTVMSCKKEIFVFG